MAMAFEPSFDIWHAAMVDIAVSPGQAPALGIGAEIRCHVLMHVLLEVKIKGIAIGADDNINADAALSRDIPARIIERDISAII